MYLTLKLLHVAFAIPGVFGIIATGVATAMLAGFPILRTGWIAWTLALFAISGIIFMARVAPLQRQMLTLARSGAESGSFDYGQYRALAVRWEIWGAAALLTPLAGLALMVLKPF